MGDALGRGWEILQRGQTELEILKEGGFTGEEGEGACAKTVNLVVQSLESVFMCCKIVR